MTTLSYFLYLLSLCLSYIYIMSKHILSSLYQSLEAAEQKRMN